MNYSTTINTDLYKTGRYREFLASCPPFQHSLPAHLRVMIAEALFFCGETETAAGIAAASEQDGAAARLTRPRFEVVRGLAARRSGDFDTAFHHFNVAVRLASETGDPQEIAWCELRRFRALIEGAKESEVAANLTNVRRWVSSAGSPRLTALLHESVAIMEGQAGRHDEARRRLDIARSILFRYPHAWLEFAVHNGAFCLSCLACDYAEAERHLRRAREVGSLIGGTYTSHIIDVNRGHIALLTGDFKLVYALTTPLLSGLNKLEQVAAIDGLGRLHLALGQHRECEAVLRRAWSVDRSNIDVYALKCTRTTEVALAIRCCKFEEAITLAESELHRARLQGDHPFIVSLLLLQAEAFAAVGNAPAASRALLEAAETHLAGPGHQQGEAYAVTAKILQITGTPYAPMILARARRMWRREQNIWAQLAYGLPGESQLPIARFRQPDVDRLIPEVPIVTPSTPQESAAAVLNGVVATFEQSFDAVLAAAELTAIAEATGCSEQVALRVANHARSSANDSATCPTTGRGGGDLVVRCTPSADLAATVAAANLMALVRQVNEFARLRREERRRAALWPALHEQHEENLFISEEMAVLAATARKIAPTNVPVLVTGETGTGKEVLARAIHAASTRRSTLFVPFNCSAGPRDMIDAQLFGHRRGAFTGATEHAPGVIRAAVGGTLFLDEIGEAPPEVQPKLLRFLESGEIHPVGEPLPAKVDVRIIAATNVDLDAAVSSGRFREDLFYRLNIVRLHLPPLRERRVEIPVFAQHYLKKYAGELTKGDLRLAEETVEYLLLYKWPGNVRQLANEMRRMAALAEADAVLMPEHLSPDIVASRRTVPASDRILDPNELVVRIDQPLAAATEHLERVMIPFALKQCNGRVEDAARKLGLSRKGLYLKRMRLGVEAPEPQEQSA